MLCMCVTSHLCTFYVSVHFLPENYFYWSTFNIRYFKIVPTAIWLSLLPKSYFKIISLLLLLFNFCLISVNLLHPEQDANLLNIHLHLCFCILAICFPLLHVCLLSCSNKKKEQRKEGRFLMSRDGLFPGSCESSWLRGQSDMWGGGGGC